MPKQFFDPGTAETKSFDLLEFLRRDVNCNRHSPDQRAPNPLVGKVTEHGFEIHFQRPLCPQYFPLDGDYELCLDGVEVGTARYVGGLAPYFSVRTDAATSARLYSALSP